MADNTSKHTDNVVVIGLGRFGRLHALTLAGLSDAELAETYPYEDWILAKSLVPTPPLTTGEYEDDMFRGVR